MTVLTEIWRRSPLSNLYSNKNTKLAFLTVAPSLLEWWSIYIIILAGCKSLKLKRSYSLGIFLTNLYSQREFIAYKNNKRDLAILLQQLARYSKSCPPLLPQRRFPALCLSNSEPPSHSPYLSHLKGREWKPVRIYHNLKHKILLEDYKVRFNLSRDLYLMRVFPCLGPWRIKRAWECLIKIRSEYRQFDLNIDTVITSNYSSWCS